jgi:undecaprenyl-phosphate galactose phosphotransferase
VVELNEFRGRAVLAPIAGDIFWDSLFPDGNFSFRGVATRRHVPSAYALARTKRVMDILIASLLLLLLSPFFIAIAPIVVLADGGPAFFMQRRVGRGGHEFNLLKFRTMREGAEGQLRRWREEDSALWHDYVAGNFKLRNDPRRTVVGRFLRRFSLDELPQLINVVRGEMSLVGPRPMLRGEIADYGRGFPQYCRLRPGITGLWQIRGRASTSFAARARYDRVYFYRASLAADLGILRKTALVVCRGCGAY